MKVYFGRVDEPMGWAVFVRDGVGALRPLEHHVKHSPDGFAWGYAGSGPTELARCILIDATGDPDPDVHLVFGYRDEVIALLDKTMGFEISALSVLSWVRNAPR